jgi:hypothetical protein
MLVGKGAESSCRAWPDQFAVSRRHAFGRKRHALLDRQRPIDEIDLFAIVAAGSNGAGIRAR